MDPSFGTDEEALPRYQTPGQFARYAFDVEVDIPLSVAERSQIRAIDDATDFAKRCPEQYEALVECVAFVNRRRIEQGDASVVALSYFLQR